MSRINELLFGLPQGIMHVSSAADFGVTKEEIPEATAVAIALGGGMAEWPARFVFKVLEELDKSEDKDKD